MSNETQLQPAMPTLAGPDQQIENWFTHHAPSPPQIEAYQVLRERAKQLAYAIYGLCPASADRSAAIRLLRESVMTANASIACGGK